MAGGAAAAAAIAQAIKASGVVVRVEPGDFEIILGRMNEGLVVLAEGGFFTKSHRYLTSYRGLAFYTESPQPLALPSACETVYARKIWIPG